MKRWMVVILMLVISPAVQAEPVHLVCTGKFRAGPGVFVPRTESIIIDLQAGTVTMGPVDAPIISHGMTGDSVIFDLPERPDMPMSGLSGNIDRITGEVFFKWDGTHGFTGTCKPAQKLF